jgi:hypothetical protein
MSRLRDAATAWLIACGLVAGLAGSTPTARAQAVAGPAPGGDSYATGGADRNVTRLLADYVPELKKDLKLTDDQIQAIGRVRADAGTRRMELLAPHASGPATGDAGPASASASFADRVRAARAEENAAILRVFSPA